MNRANRERDEWRKYQRWLDSFGERCRHCALPVFWHSKPRGPYRCIVNAKLPAPPGDKSPLT